ncbi:hypothetical protein A4A49_16691 [Nicotiana attenuata]|uniref:Uncharacterized protein n=1 Tax=Nicotiana attenuata TaxID=49451 RepID=A0A314L8K5_NICAT|nr:hypothetical protein A4A49_16691 [Nicotiana attenuata]
MFESLDIHFDIPHCFSSALYSVVVSLNGNMEGGKFSNEMSSCIMDVQTVPPRPPRALPKPHFLALLLDFLAQVSHSVAITKNLNSNGLVIIGVDDSNIFARLLAAKFSCKMHPAATAFVAILHEQKVLKSRSGYKVKLHAVHLAPYTFYGVIKMIELVASHRLHHDLGHALVYVILLNKCMVVGKDLIELNLIMMINSTVNQIEHSWLIAVAMEKFGKEKTAKTVHLYFMVDNSSFDESEHVKKCSRSYISHAFGDPFDHSSTLEGILGIQLSETITYIVAYHATISFYREGDASTNTKKVFNWPAFTLGQASPLVLVLSSGIDAEREWIESGIVAIVGHICELLLERTTNSPHVVEKVYGTANIASKIRTMPYESFE